MTQSRCLALVVCMVLPTGPHLLGGVTSRAPTIQKTCTTKDSRESNRNVREKLKSVWSGDGRAADGTFLELNSYETAAGIRVSITRGKFSSPSAAQKELNLLVKQATNIIEREIRKNSSGQPIGVRARGVFPSTKPHEEYNVILWTDGEKYYWVSSPSLDIALQVEEDLNTHSFHQRFEPSK